MIPQVTEEAITAYESEAKRKILNDPQIRFAICDRFELLEKDQPILNLWLLRTCNQLKKEGFSEVQSATVMDIVCAFYKLLYRQSEAENEAQPS